jgi:hypothetical protein
MGIYALGVELTMGIDLSMVRKQMEYGHQLWVDELYLAKNDNKGIPPKEVYAEFILHFDLRAETTKERINTLAGAIDAAYCHLAAPCCQSLTSACVIR